MTTNRSARDSGDSYGHFRAKSDRQANKPLEWWPGGEKDGSALVQHERVTEVKTYLVQLTCPKCQKGELHYQEDAVFSAGGHTHVCDNNQCGWMVRAGLKNLHRTISGVSA